MTSSGAGTTTRPRTPSSGSSTARSRSTAGWCARRSPPRARGCGRSAAAAPIPAPDATTLERGLAEVLAKLEADPTLPRGRRRGRPQLRRGAARRDRGRARRPGAPRPQPQRADGHGAAALRARRDRRARAGVRARWCGALVEQGRAGADAVMPGYTHTRAAEPITFGFWAAAHAWGAGARPRAAARRPRARRRAAARLGRARRRVAAARPRGDGQGPRLRGRLARRARRRDGPRLRRRARLVLRAAADPPRAPRRGPDPLRGPRVRLRARCPRPSPPARR